MSSLDTSIGFETNSVVERIEPFFGVHRDVTLQWESALLRHRILQTLQMPFYFQLRFYVHISPGYYLARVVSARTRYVLLYGNGTETRTYHVEMCWSHAPNISKDISRSDLKYLEGLYAMLEFYLEILSLNWPGWFIHDKSRFFFLLSKV